MLPAPGTLSQRHDPDQNIEPPPAFAAGKVLGGDMTLRTALRLADSRTITAVIDTFVLQQPVPGGNKMMR